MLKYLDVTTFLTIVAVDGCDVRHTLISFMVFQGALAQRQNGPGGVPQDIVDGWRCSEEVSPRFASATFTALTLTVHVELGMVLLLRGAVANRTRV